tara:strand:+ start:98 stop:271 length:174 start_codon:yes stop_codon:yes gene_type:complete
MTKIKSSQWSSMIGSDIVGGITNQCLKYRTVNGLIRNGSPIHKTDKCIEFKRSKHVR